jgi:hypothetical protein
MNNLNDHLDLCTRLSSVFYAYDPQEQGRAVSMLSHPARSQIIENDYGSRKE